MITSVEAMSLFVLGLKDQSDVLLNILRILLINSLNPENSQPTEFNEDELRIMLRAVDHEIQTRRENEHGVEQDVEANVEDAEDAEDADVDDVEDADVEDSEDNKSYEDADVEVEDADVDDSDVEAAEAVEDADDADVEERSENRSLRVSCHSNSPRPSNTTFLFGSIRMAARTLQVILINLDLGYVCFPKVHKDLGDGAKVYKVSIGLKDQSVANLYNRHTAVQMPTGNNMSIAVRLL